MSSVRSTEGNVSGVYLVTLTDARFTITVENGRIVATADIGKWMRGKTLRMIQQWAKNPGIKGIVERIQ